ncbi:MAG: hypothetical protein GYA48_04990 [Chloroflexi bacterium]|nr:hypothetical protein [Chloroflexota bacterium]
MAQQLIQAYKQAPWRVQIQRIGVFMVILVVALVIAGLYLFVSAQSAQAAIELRNYKNDIAVSQHNASDLSTQLANITSAEAMQQRASEMGFVPYRSDEASYLTIPGYYGRKPAIAAPAPGRQPLPQPLVKPAYSQSLWDWMTESYQMWTEPPAIGGAQ